MSSKVRTLKILSQSFFDTALPDVGTASSHISKRVQWPLFIDDESQKILTSELLNLHRSGISIPSLRITQDNLDDLSTSIGGEYYPKRHVHGQPYANPPKINLFLPRTPNKWFPWEKGPITQYTYENDLIGTLHHEFGHHVTYEALVGPYWINNTVPYAIGSSKQLPRAFLSPLIENMKTTRFLSTSRRKFATDVGEALGSEYATTNDYEAVAEMFAVRRLAPHRRSLNEALRMTFARSSGGLSRVRNAGAFPRTGGNASFTGIDS